MKYVEKWWSNADGTKPKTSERNLFQCHIVYQKSLMNWTGEEPGSPQRYPCANLWRRHVMASHSPDTPVRTPRYTCILFQVYLLEDVRSMICSYVAAIHEMREILSARLEL